LSRHLSSNALPSTSNEYDQSFNAEAPRRWWDAGFERSVSNGLFSHFGSWDFVIGGDQICGAEPAAGQIITTSPIKCQLAGFIKKVKPAKFVVTSNARNQGLPSTYPLTACGIQFKTIKKERAKMALNKPTLSIDIISLCGIPLTQDA
jgi:hypothetical protein